MKVDSEPMVSDDGLMVTLPASLAAHDSAVTEGPQGQLGHRDLIAHTERLAPKMWEVTPQVWCVVGNGLSNQTFVEGPEGLIVIDTGESNEEMAAALAQVRTVTSAPVAAVLYTHFHYVAGTEAVMAEAGRDLPVWGHQGIVGNLRRVGVDLHAAAGRGLVHQFGMLLPQDGPDGIINVGLGLEYRRAEHAPFTPGFIPPTHEIDGPMSTTIAGLQVEFSLAPSDADDSITIWFPELSVCVNNLVWPALFNVFAIRGEEYRDPRILLNGLDHIAGLQPEHLVGAHGPPLSGREEVNHEVEVYRDSIQFLWDQTVRGINRGLTNEELVEFVQLPSDYGRTYRTQQLYGLVEHHVRQIHAGLRGWFDGDESKLLAVPRAEKCRRFVEGFGGADEVRSQVREALANDDIRWALELASWLVHRVEPEAGGGLAAAEDEDRGLLAQGLRMAAQRTTSSNIRNWCLTRALELEGRLDLTRFRTHRLNHRQILASEPEVYVEALRVLVDPARAAGIDAHVGFAFDGGEPSAGLHIRRGVAVPTQAALAATFTGTVHLQHDTWAAILSGRTTLADEVKAGNVAISGDQKLTLEAMHSFDVPGLSEGAI